MITPEGRIGIIDIGSNSIRLVIYDQQKRSPVAIYNEKVMCALGKGLASTGILNPEGVVLAREAIRRFVAMGRNMQISTMHVVATAAVRDAKDGVDFTRSLEEMHDITIDIISGDKEARLGAYAVCSSMHKPKGITGDLGGGSLELVRVHDGEVGEHTSLPLGSLRMVDETKGDREKLKKIIAKQFEKLDWLGDEKTPCFYAIGGSFRALAKMHLVANHYPLSILHEYKIDAKNFLNFAREIAILSNEKLEKYPGSAIKRVPQLPGAAMLLEQILTTSKAENIVFSASGIREGYIYEMLSPDLRAQDGLIASCHEFASRGGRTISYANELFTWMFPLFADENDKERRLRLAFCLLSDIALHIHPEYRAEWAFDRILFSAMTCLTHRERVKLALALYHRYQFKVKSEFAVLKLITDNDRKWARLVGSAANLAYHLSGSTSGNLHNAALDLSQGNARLHLSDNMRDILGDAVIRRLSGVDEALRA